ncbi:hypothetical protein LGH70_01815 [Hymenobacter sp. BT635]|uniref:Metal-dependent HD superfamily phosphohydrolase n=1 Tax=Hymenobacter nitidus TaxID=2880929 RepID=A0ABS8A7D3_9BACT|nr:hypothetical protein [Hymenobacter nitidus]MCB2376300.1 hypothetical protein [Hymenobacter nitidus]
MTPTTLEARWQQLNARLGVPEALRDTTFRQLAAAYEGSGRHYHTLTHIRTLLETQAQHPEPLHDPEVVQLAVWFHDAVYNPLRDDNEVRSAQLAQEFMAKTSLPAERRQRVVFLIERTKDHTQPQPATDTDLHFFLDADLQILGAAEADYWQYARQVRQEYRLVPDILYRRGRRQVLEKLLLTPVLYQTPGFRQRLDAAARLNLQAELRQWEKGGL